MELTERFDRAFLLASNLHRRQRRKCIASPYLGHLMAVAAMVCENIGLLAEAPEDPELYVMAAILHDTVEDQGGLETLALLRENFGERLAEIVWTLSDSAPGVGELRPRKAERSALYRKKIAAADAATTLISCCDKIHNLQSLVLDHQILGPRLWHAYSSSPSESLRNYQELGEIFSKKLKGHRLLSRYQAALAAFSEIVSALSL